VLGRSDDCDCVLNDPTVSRSHARLSFRDGSWWLGDLGSANGTRVNGWRVIGEVEVRPGDSVSFGAARYRLTMPR
jgi:pSer/pThr/pTyr-binding forkhead associated (FHA) protein